MTFSCLHTITQRLFVSLALLLLLTAESSFSQPHQGPRMPTARFGMASARLENKLYLIGGDKGDVQELHGCNTVEAFTLSTEEWNAQIDQLHIPRMYASAVTFNNRIYVIGGIDDRGHTLNSVEMYNPDINKWMSLAPMINARFSASATVSGNYIYILGGADSTRHLLDKVERYSFANDKWEVQPSLATARAFHASVKVDSSILIFGGVRELQLLSSYEKYLPGTGSVFSRNLLSVPKAKFAFIDIDTSILVIGGEGISGSLKSIESVDFRNGSAVTLLSTKMGSPRTDFVAAWNGNGRVYFFGGLSPDFKNGNESVPFVDTITIPKTATGVADNPSFVPTSLSLGQNYPNPFNPTTTITFDIPGGGGNSRLSVFNLLGQEVKILLDNRLEAGHHQVSFDASDLPSGLYFYTLRMDNATLTKKMTVVK